MLLRSLWMCALTAAVVALAPGRSQASTQEAPPLLLPPPKAAVTVERVRFEVYLKCADGTQGKPVAFTLSVPQAYGQWFFSPTQNEARDPWSVSTVLYNPCPAPDRRTVSFDVRNVTTDDFRLVGESNQPYRFRTVLTVKGTQGVLPVSAWGATLIVNRTSVRTDTFPGAEAAIDAARQAGVVYE